MAFGGFPAAPSVPNPVGVALDANGNLPPNPSPTATLTSSVQRNRLLYNTSTLAARAGAPAPAAADTGELTTAAPAANQHGLPLNFGKGRGNWLESDLAFFRDVRSPRADAALVGGANAGPDIHLSAKGFTPGPDGVHGDWLFQFHNRGAAASGVMEIGIEFGHSAIR